MRAHCKPRRFLRRAKRRRHPCHDPDRRERERCSIRSRAVVETPRREERALRAAHRSPADASRASSRSRRARATPSRCRRAGRARERVDVGPDAERRRAAPRDRREIDGRRRRARSSARGARRRRGSGWSSSRTRDDRIVTTGGGGACAAQEAARLAMSAHRAREGMVGDSTRHGRSVDHENDHEHHTSAAGPSSEGSSCRNPARPSPLHANPLSSCDRRLRLFVDGRARVLHPRRHAEPARDGGRLDSRRRDRGRRARYDDRRSPTQATTLEHRRRATRARADGSMGPSYGDVHDTSRWSQLALARRRRHAAIVHHRRCSTGATSTSLPATTARRTPSRRSRVTTPRPRGPHRARDDVRSRDRLGQREGARRGAFDGRYVYFARKERTAPETAIVRYDTLAPFATASSWTVFDSTTAPNAPARFEAPRSTGGGVHVRRIGKDDGTTPTPFRYDTQGRSVRRRRGRST